MLEWFTGGSADTLGTLIQGLQKRTETEIRRLSDINGFYEDFEKIVALVHQQGDVRNIEKQLVYQFNKQRKELFEKDAELAARLEMLTMQLRENADDVHLRIMSLEEAIKKRDKTPGPKGAWQAQIVQEKETIKEGLVMLQRVLKDAREIAEYLKRLTIIPTIQCTRQFLTKLSTPFIMQQLKNVEELIIHMSDRAWLTKNGVCIKLIGVL